MTKIQPEERHIARMKGRMNKLRRERRILLRQKFGN